MSKLLSPRLYVEEYLPWLWVERLSLLVSMPGRGAENEGVRVKNGAVLVLLALVRCKLDAKTQEVCSGKAPFTKIGFVAWY